MDTQETLEYEHPEGLGEIPKLESSFPTLHASADGDPTEQSASATSPHPKLDRLLATSQLAEPPCQVETPDPTKPPPVNGTETSESAKTCSAKGTEATDSAKPPLTHSAKGTEDTDSAKHPLSHDSGTEPADSAKPPLAEATSPPQNFSPGFANSDQAKPAPEIVEPNLQTSEEEPVEPAKHQPEARIPEEPAPSPCASAASEDFEGSGVATPDLLKCQAGLRFVLDSWLQWCTLRSSQIGV